MNTDVKLGMQVMTADGQRVGRVDRLVVDPDRQEFLEMIVQKGFLLTTDRIIDKEYIDHVEDDNVILSLDADTVHDLPQFSAREYSVASSVDGGPLPFSMGAGPTTNQPILWRAGTGRRELHSTSLNAYQVAVSEAATVEVRTSLPAASVVIDRGTDVITADDHKIGVIDELIYTEDGSISGLVVRAGHLQHHDITVPISQVAAITHRYVRLNVERDAFDDPETDDVPLV